MQFLSIVLYSFLLWRVETLPQLENVAVEEQAEQTEEQPEEQLEEPGSQPLAIPSNIEQLLDERCVATQLYLQHDITLPQPQHLQSRFQAAHGAICNHLDAGYVVSKFTKFECCIQKHFYFQKIDYFCAFIVRNHIKLYHPEKTIHYFGSSGNDICRLQERKQRQPCQS